MNLYGKNIIQRKNTDRQTSAIFFDLFWNFFCSDSRYLISADIIYTEPHTTVPTIWMDTALWVSCSAYLSGMGIKYLIFPFLLVIVCGRKKSLNWNWQPPWSGRLCLNFTAKIMSSSFVKAGILCHFREKYRNTYKIKCYNKGLKTDDSLTSLSFIKL